MPIQLSFKILFLFNYITLPSKFTPDFKKLVIFISILLLSLLSMFTSNPKSYYLSRLSSLPPLPTTPPLSLSITRSSSHPHISLPCPLLTTLTSLLSSPPLCPSHWEPILHLCSCTLPLCLTCLLTHTCPPSPLPYLSSLNLYLNILDSLSNPLNSIEILIEKHEISSAERKLVYCFRNKEGYEWWDGWRKGREKVVDWMYGMEKVKVRWEKGKWRIGKVRGEWMDGEKEGGVRWKAEEEVVLTMEWGWRQRKRRRVLEVRTMVLGKGEEKEVRLPFYMGWKNFVKRAKFVWVVGMARVDRKLEEVREMIRGNDSFMEGLKKVKELIDEGYKPNWDQEKKDHMISQ